MIVSIVVAVVVIVVVVDKLAEVEAGGSVVNACIQVDRRTKSFR